jgi:hypothetical protein
MQKMQMHMKNSNKKYEKYKYAMSEIKYKITTDLPIGTQGFNIFSLLNKTLSSVNWKLD